MAIAVPITNFTSCVDPRTDPSRNLGAKGEGDSTGQYGVPAVYERSFKWKVGHFRNLCAVSQYSSRYHSNVTTTMAQANRLPEHILIHVSRENIFEESFNHVTIL